MIDPEMGTRHRAALGISEETDVIAIVVSEENSRISVAVNGIFNLNLDEYSLKRFLDENLFVSSGEQFDSIDCQQYYFRNIWIYQNLKTFFSIQINVTAILGGIFDLKTVNSKLTKLKQQTLSEDFWANTVSAQSILKEISLYEKEIEFWNGAERKKDDCEVLLTFIEDE